MGRPRAFDVSVHLRLSNETREMLARLATFRQTDGSTVMRQLIAEEYRRMNVETYGVDRVRSVAEFFALCDRHNLSGERIAQLWSWLPEDVVVGEGESPTGQVVYRIGGGDGPLMSANQPYSIVEQFGDWFHAYGQDARAGIGTVGMEWSLFTKDQSEAIAAATLHMKR